MNNPKSAGVLVTGAGSGIGLEIVRALLREHDCAVWAVARNAHARLNTERQGFPGRLRLIDCDLSHSGSIQLISQAVGRHRLLGLVHNAAMLGKTAFGSYNRQDLIALYEINAIVPMLLTQALAPLLVGEPPGHVVHISSMGGFQDSTKFPGLAGYSSSKAALACMAQCIAEEFRDQGLRSNCLALGAVDTAMLQAAFPDYRATTQAASMGGFIARFTLEGHNHFNGKVLPVSTSTP